MRPRSGQRGFTLMELIAVTVIMAMAFTVAAVRMDWLIPKYKLRGAARELGAFLKEARHRAVGSGRDVYVVYNLAAGTYEMLVAFPAEEEDYFAPSEEKFTGLPKGFIYQRSHRGVLPGADDPYDSNKVEFVDVLIAGERPVERGIVRVRIPPYGVGEHHIVNLRLGEDEEQIVAVKLNGFTGHLSFYDERQAPDEVLEDW